MQEWQALIIIQDISDLHRQAAESQRLRKQAQEEITERKQVEKAQAHLQRAVDQGIEGLALLDHEGKYTYINRAHAAMYGYSVKELLGLSWKILYLKISWTPLRKSASLNSAVLGIGRENSSAFEKMGGTCRWRFLCPYS